MPVDLRTCRSDITSQSGENGVIAAIFCEIGITNRFCVEFGGYDAVKYSNVNPLWTREGFTAVIIEGDPAVARKVQEQVEQITRAGIAAGGRCVVVARWVQPSGPDGLDGILAGLAATGVQVPREPDLVSIDIDSVDYQVWDGITHHRPRVVVIEHNPSVPTQFSIIGEPGKVRVGASARALYDLGVKKGYTLVGCTKFNSFFVADELKPRERFVDAGNLGTHFDTSQIVYVMRAYDGGMFYSSRLRAAYSLRASEIEGFAPGKGFATRPSDLTGLLRHPKLIVKRAWDRLKGR